MNRTAKESRFIYTAYGIKSKNGEKIGGCGNQVDYIPCYYDFDPVRLEICLTLKDYKRLSIIPNGCNIRNNSDSMIDYYETDRLTIPASAGAEFLAAAIGYKKHLEVIRKKGEKADYYKAAYDHAKQFADALELAEQIASGKIENSEEIISKRIKADKEHKEQARLESNKAYALELLKQGSKNGKTVEQLNDLVIMSELRSVRIYDFGEHHGEPQLLKTVIAINIKTGEREQITEATLAEASEFYKRITA